MALFFAGGFNELEEFINVNYTVRIGICGMENRTGFIGGVTEAERFQSTLEFSYGQMVLASHVSSMERSYSAFVLGRRRRLELLAEGSDWRRL